MPKNKKKRKKNKKEKIFESGKHYKEEKGVVVSFDDAKAREVGQS